MMKRLSLSILLLATLSACGGGGGGSGNVTRTCDFPADGTCDVLSGPASALDALGMTQASCEAAGGTYGATCGATARVGRCAWTETNGAVSASLVESFYAPAWTVVTAEDECVNFLEGTFTAN